MAKAAGRSVPAPPVVFERDEFKYVCFSREVIAERETFRRLAHRIVDLAVDSGRHSWLRAEVGYSLSCIARDHVIKMVTDLVHEARAEANEARRG